MEYKLVVLLTVELIINFLLSKKDVFSPPVIFNSVFLVSAVNLFFMVSYWQVSISDITIRIIMFGTIAFSITFYILNKIKITKRGVKVCFKTQYSKISFAPQKPIEISENVLRICSFFYLFIVIVFYSFPELGKSLFTYIFYPAYVFGYIFLNQLVLLKRVNLKLVLILILSGVSVLIVGGRGDIINLIVTLFILYVLMVRRDVKSKVKKRFYVLLMVVAIVFVLVFQNLGILLGRDSGRYGFSEYISIYLGAPILNLNTSVIFGNFTNDIFLSETFHEFYLKVGELFGIEKFIYKTDRIFWKSANNLNVGNVATTFYDFYHDGGMTGVIILSCLSALIIYFFYVRAYGTRDTENINITSIAYAYMLFLLARSFFSNSLLNALPYSLFKFMLVWWVTKWILNHIKIKVYNTQEVKNV